MSSLKIIYRPPLESYHPENRDIEVRFLNREA